MAKSLALALCASCALAVSAGEKPVEVAVYYFGNYHRDARNEKRYGEGWTEWKLVKEATPRFEGHRQPRVPAWGYADEADPAEMARKIDAAASHGVDAFIFDWYWYDDGPFLERSLDDGFLKAPNRDRLKFALMWANHDWVEIFPARKGVAPQLIYPGRVSPETFDRICDHVIGDYFRQPNYWKIDGKPYFSVYELTKFVESFGSREGAKAAIAKFREKTAAAGLPGLHLNAVYWGIPNIPGEGQVAEPEKFIEELGFDSVTSYVWIHHVALPERETDYNYVRDAYFSHWDRAKKSFSIPYYPNASVGWDSSPRTDQSGEWGGWGYPYTNIISGNGPERFKEALGKIKERLDADATLPGIVTVNSWNEWTEGSYLEPDTVYGMQYLEALRDTFGK